MIKLQTTYIKRPSVITAIKWTADNTKEVLDFLGEFGKLNQEDDAVVINTHGDATTALVGDWVIKGTHGEFYPCKDDIFKANYDEQVL